jgi:hypothetical protein
MALYLDEQTRPYLEKKFENTEDWDWIGKRIQTMLKADRERLEKIALCEHVAGEYVGKKTCCTKCGSYFDEGMGQNWTLKEFA